MLRYVKMMSLPVQQRFHTAGRPWIRHLAGAASRCARLHNIAFSIPLSGSKHVYFMRVWYHITGKHQHTCNGPQRTALSRAQALYPVHQLMQYVSLAAPQPERGMFDRGALAVTLAQREHRAAGASRLHLVMRLPRPAWGSLNITGDVRGWSFTDVLSQARPDQQCCRRQLAKRQKSFSVATPCDAAVPARLRRSVRNRRHARLACHMCAVASAIFAQRMESFIKSLINAPTLHTTVVL